MDQILEELKIASIQFKQFGTDVDFQIVISGESLVDNAEKDLKQAQQMCEKFEKVFSRFDEQSELSKINKNLGESIKVSPLFLKVSNLVINSYNETDGYFDPRVIEVLEGIGYDKNFSEISPLIEAQKKDRKTEKRNLSEDFVVLGDKIIFNARMDFAGFVKGFAVDQVADFFHAKGWKNFLVDCGGDMFFAGKDKNSNPWYIDVEGIPFESLMIELSGRGIATSGIGKRKWEVAGKRVHHLIDPKNPEIFSFDLKSVTVVDSLTQRADVLAKTIFLMGKERGIEFATEKEIPCIILDYKGAAVLSPEIKKYIHSPR